MKVFVKETGIQLVGGNVGVTVFDYLSNYAAGLIIKPETTNPEVMRAVINTVVKGLGGAGVMAGANKLNGRSKDVGNFLVGMGGGPIMTILNDWVKAFPKSSGATVGDGAFRAAQLKKTTGIMTAPTAAVRTAPTRATTSAAALRLGVF